MRNQPETLHEYNIPRLHWWFLISSAVFVGCLVLMVWVDYSGGEIKWLGLRGDRQWKQYQRAFYNIEKQRLAGDAKAAEVRANEQGLSRMLAEKTKDEEQIKAKHADVLSASNRVEKARVEQFLVTRDFTMRKADRDQSRSFYEGVLERKNLNANDREVRELKEKTEQLNGVIDELELQKQTADAKVAAAETKLKSIVGEEEALTRDIQRMESNIGLITRRLDQLKSPLVQAVVNAPLLEFAASNYRVEQIVADTHHVDVNFTTVPRVDRCISCHKSIDRKDPSPEELEFRVKHKIDTIEFSKLPQPLRNHPRLDLFVGENSPHPGSKFGCTVCHWGWDRETTFARAGHTPADEVEESEWKKKYDWEHQEFLLQPMRAPKYVEASCLKCHNEQTNLHGAEQLDRGRRLIEQVGCWACHKMKQLETYSVHQVAAGEDFDSICKFYDVNPADVRRLNTLPGQVTLRVGQELNIPIRTLRKPGPSLYKIASKTNREWVRKWLEDPVAFRPNTYMPRYWDLDNNKQTPARNAVEMEAIAEFLFTVSEHTNYPAPPIAGDAERGKNLVSTLGCMGCHVIDEDRTKLKPTEQLANMMDEWQYRRLRSQGPMLGGTGSKTSVNWLYAWLKDPKQYHPQTKMPNLRLSDQDAVDAAQYLSTLHNEATDRKELTAVESNELNNVALEYLEVTFPHTQALEKINDLDDLIDQYFASEDVQDYYTDATKLARETAQQSALKKQYEEEFDEAIGKKAKELEAHLTDVKAKMDDAKQKAAALGLASKKNVFLGSRLVNRYGCFACHNINGFQGAKQIGTELSEWGSKPLSQLDFGLIDLAHDRNAWLKQKLHAPRSFDTGRIGVTRKPQELLKMPKFNLTEEQIDQIVTVISGMTNEKLTPKEAQQLSPADFQIERGRWMVKELNCIGCHIVEGQGGAIRATIEQTGMEPPMLSGLPGQLRQGQRTQPDWLFNFLKAPQTGQIRPWLHVRMPTFGFTDAEANVLVRYFALEGRALYPYQTPKIDSSSEHLLAGRQLFDQLKCALCHIVEGKALGKSLAEIPEEDLPRLAPNLSQAHGRLQRDWLINKWLPEPLAQVPGTRMPQFEYGPQLAPNILGGDGVKQREAIVDYVLSLGTPATTARIAQ